MKKKEKTMKNVEKDRKNNEQWWKIAENKDTWWKIEEKQWKMMNKRGKTRNNDEEKWK